MDGRMTTWTALVPPQVWCPVGPWWVWIGGNVLGDDHPVRITVGDPFGVAFDEMVHGLRVLPHPPDPDIADPEEFR